MRTIISWPLILVVLSACAVAQQSLVVHSNRLKILPVTDPTVTGDNFIRLVAGIWVSESKDPTKRLVFPQQVKITCAQPRKTCTELVLTLAEAKDLISIQDIDSEDYDISSWDSHGLVASYGGDEHSRCQRHVLTMDFDSGAVSVSDIPTHKKGCEAFNETDSYRLVRGNYYVDTTPGNDLDKPAK
jgi:hypothetical protein